MKQQNLKIATRESQLALWQTRYVAKAYQAHYPGDTVELVPMTTQGDQIQDKPLNAIGGKALFMKALEVAMEAGQANCAVHSLKDVPYALPEGFVLAAFCPRGTPNDAFVSNQYQTFDQLPDSAVVGTSSLRRQAQIQAHWPHLIVKSLRGNVQTRLRKLDEGQYDAIVLAAAGLERLELHHRITQYIPVDQMIPAVGQGVIVIECHRDDHQARKRLAVLDHDATRQLVLAERALNEALEGGCHVPVGAYAQWQEDQIKLVGFVASVDGKQLCQAQGLGKDPVALGQQVAEALINQGARSILQQAHS